MTRHRVSYQRDRAITDHGYTVKPSMTKTESSVKFPSTELFVLLTPLLNIHGLLFINFIFFLEGRKINVVVYIFLMSEAKQERVSCHAV